MLSNIIVGRQIKTSNNQSFCSNTCNTCLFMHNLAGSTPTSSSQRHVNCFLVRAHISEHSQNGLVTTHSTNPASSIRKQIHCPSTATSSVQHCRSPMSHKHQAWTASRQQQTNLPPEVSINKQASSSALASIQQQRSRGTCRPDSPTDFFQLN